MSIFKRLDHLLITIPKGKKEEARQFYTNIIALEKIPGNHPHGALWFNIGDIQLHIREETDVNFSDRHPAFEVLNLKMAEQFLQQRKIDIHYSSEIDGRQRCFFRDPFGNRFELLEFNQ